MRFFADSISKIKKEHIIYCMAVCVLNIVFFFLLGNSGALFEKDSYTYVKWSYLIIRKGYSLYPWFIKLIRMIHGETTFLALVPIYQAIISIVCNLVLVEYIRRRFDISLILGILIHVCILAPYTYTLPEAVSSHYILTEGLSIPLFHISVFFLLKGILDKNFASELISILFGALLFLIRPQLIIILFVYVFIIFVSKFYNWTIKHNKTCFISTLWILLVFAIIIGIITYFAIIAGWSNSRGNSQLIEATTGKALCLLSEEDAEFYSGIEREVYITLFNDCKENGRLLSDLPDSILDYESLHRIINENVTAHETVIWDYYNSIRGDDGGLDAYATRNLITSTEIMNHKLRYVGIILRLMPSSLVASVFFQPPSIRMVCYIFVVVLYSIAILMLVYANKLRVDKTYAIPEIISMIVIFANSIACNISLYGQQRYVIYCMGLFYASLLIEAIGIFNKKKYVI